jgi:antitoxin (DNA-binding transcriptional repressor) of toxin-antitoxin stability system
MKTIGAKELRQNLDKILDQVLSGQDIIVSHRFKDPVRLSAFHTSKNKLKKLSGLQAFDNAPKRPVRFDRRKSIKQLYKESVAKKYANK